jgi:CRISPR-associated protein Cas5h
MNNRVIVSFILKADFGFFRKPDTNEGINLSYNVIHRPSILGILGAIVGLEGYQEFGKLPEYYNTFKDLRVSIEPVEEQLYFQKTTLKYNNTTGFANKDGQLKIQTTLNIEESLLISPVYKIYVELDLDVEIEKKLKENITKQQAEYLPYFGKNECLVSWDCADCEVILDYQKFNFDSDFSISSFFCFKDNQTDSIQNSISKAVVSGRRARSSNNQPFVYFERLPTCLEAKPVEWEEDKQLKYGYNDLNKFVYTNVIFDKNNTWEIELQKLSNGKLIQLFN